MGRGNVCVYNDYEGLYYIDADHYVTYARNIPDETGEDDLAYETKLLGDLTFEDLNKNEWRYDDELTRREFEDILTEFKSAFMRRFKSFEEPAKRIWLNDRDRDVILENELFYIAIEDNQWSTAIELLQKNDSYDDHLIGLQKKHFQNYLEEMKNVLLDILPYIGSYGSAWTNGIIRKEDIA